MDLPTPAELKFVVNKPVALLRQPIFAYRDLWKLLDQPDRPPVVVGRGATEH